MRIVKAQEFKEETLNQVLNRGKSDISSIESSVRKIISNVKEQGDKALLQYTEKFDKVRLPASKLKVDKREIKEAYKKLKKSQISALRKAADNIASFHKKQLRAKWTLEIAE
ncbi:unnamed protein product, partial [marine sediment metagenome]